MDPVTHLSSGLMGGLAARRWFPEAKFLLPACVLAAWIPDADILFSDGPEFNLLYHRGVSTSFFGTLVLALALAGLYKLVSRRTPFVKIAALFYALTLTHVWLDLITTYGTQLLAPFSNHRFALDGAFIIDPVFTLTALALLATAGLGKKHRQTIALVGMAWFFAYPLANMAAGAILQNVYAHRLDARGVAHDHVRVTPDALSPRFWKVVVTAGPDYLLDTMDLFGDREPTAPLRVRRADKTFLRALGKQQSMFATYAWFTLWPYVEETDTPEGRTLVFRDLRFASTNPVMTWYYDGKRLPFTLVAHLDHTGRLTAWSYEGGISALADAGEPPQ
ncbi:membrane-bound metal-dependent hydrolase [Pseudodesulfovibrio mercurii]|uniref:Membrane-bound metal-dependent hydrolase n=1 Tax=Pseudodesulfovibrio mercurii TaxID=641491 RepID=F0JH04_9BACT|nr:metal-dependent hydrolase [Pseudodesulfovibrio mercurii]EGB13943.1 membrane-bound metal-dependent hydrolase [Pseudodesulfovibrio mercurii]